MIDVLVVDDHPLIRSGWRAVLEGEPDIRVSGEAWDRASTMARLQERPHDVIVLDLILKREDGGEEFGLDVLAEIRKHKPRQQVLVVSMMEDRLFLLQALKSGASGYLQKAVHPNILVAGVRAVAAGRRFLHDRQQDLVASLLLGEELPLPHERLTQAELSAFILLGKGRTVADIAKLLGKSPSTVHNQRQACLDKTGLHNNAEIIIYCIHYRLF